MRKYIVIVAGGIGKRMQSQVPKQFIQIGDKPLLMHTMNRLHTFSANMELILVLPKDYQQYWQKLCLKHNCRIPHHVVSGGITRFHSVRNGLAAIHDEGIVGIHDGVRPFVDDATLERLFELAHSSGTAVPVIRMTESVREVSSDYENRPINRSRLRVVQTPQCFRVSLLKKAYEQDYQETFTDDASVAEAMGEDIHLTEGNPQNIKVTEPLDLIIASAFLEK